MARLRSEVLDWLDTGRVVPGREGEVLHAAGMLPARSDWRRFLEHLALWLGTLALAAAIIFFFAFNWDVLGRFAKFGLVEAGILAGLLVCWRADLDGMAGKAVLTLLSLFVGALLALAGQTYQTGADTFELFGYWALLILPWVLVSRFSPLWLIWLALLNVAVFLFFQRSWSGEALLWPLFGLDSLALVAWEAAHRSGVSWLRDGWPPRLVAIGSGTMVTALAIWAIMDSGARFGAAGGLAYLVWLACFYYWYRHVRPDLFMLAGGVLSLVVTVVAFLSRHMLEGGAGAFLFIGLVVIGLSAAGGLWLKSVAQEQRA